MIGLRIRPIKTVAVFYASESLLEQIGAWGRAHTDHELLLSDSRTATGIRAAVRSAGTVVIDATRVPGQAITAFQEAVPEAGRSHVAVYTEQMHDGLEVFVRARGVLLMLGPMAADEWDAVFASLSTRANRLISKNA